LDVEFDDKKPHVVSAEAEQWGIELADLIQQARLIATNAKRQAEYRRKAKDTP
jgi:hypothetical protein